MEILCLPPNLNYQSYFYQTVHWYLINRMVFSFLQRICYSLTSCIKKIADHPCYNVIFYLRLLCALSKSIKSGKIRKLGNYHQTAVWKRLNILKISMMELTPLKAMYSSCSCWLFRRKTRVQPSGQTSKQHLCIKLIHTT